MDQSTNDAQYDIICSLVTFNNDFDTLKKVIKSILNSSLNIHIFIADNSYTDDIRIICDDQRITYIKNEKNLGFGSGHNTIIKKTMGQSPYHLVINPDVYFDQNVLEKLFDFLESNPTVGMVSPKILYPNGNLQYTCRLLPSPVDLFLRRSLLLSKVFRNRMHFHEMRFTRYNHIMEVPFLLGCFLLIRTSALEKIGLFDERFFMYLEDSDLSRRMATTYKNIFYPYVQVTHLYERGSAKSMKLLKYHLVSAIKYFNKWGWIYDPQRKKINEKSIYNINNHEKQIFTSKG